METIGAILSGLVISAQTSIVPWIIAGGFIMGGAVWALGNRILGQSMVFGTFVGGGIMYAAVQIGNSLSTVAKAVPKP